MEKVTGIGGVFFRAEDPSALQGWYAENLGVQPPPETYEEPEWCQEAGPTVFAAFGENSEHFERAEQRWSINFRVRDLDAMVAQLRGAGIDVEVDPEVCPQRALRRAGRPGGHPRPALGAFIHAVIGGRSHGGGSTRHQARTPRKASEAKFRELPFHALR